MLQQQYCLKKNGKLLAYRNFNNIGSSHHLIKNTFIPGYYLSSLIQDATVFHTANDAKIFLSQKNGDFWNGFLIVRL
jgi:hypothetical protein